MRIRLGLGLLSMRRALVNVRESPLAATAPVSGYGIGELTSVAILAELGLPAVHLLPVRGALRRAGCHEAGEM
jgi:hypothetical protein